MKEGGYTKPGKLIYLRKGKETELYMIDDNLYLIIANKSSQSVLYTNVPAPIALATGKTDD